MRNVVARAPVEARSSGEQAAQGVTGTLETPGKRGTAMKRALLGVVVVLAAIAGVEAGEQRKTNTSVDGTLSVDIGPLSVTRSCKVTNPRDCSTTVSVSAAGVTASVSSNGDACVGVTAKGGAGVYGKGSAVTCGNLRDGSTATKFSGSIGAGAGLDAISAGVSAGASVTIRKDAPPKKR